MFMVLISLGDPHFFYRPLASAGGFFCVPPFFPLCALLPYPRSLRTGDPVLSPHGGTQAPFLPPPACHHPASLRSGCGSSASRVVLCIPFSLSWVVILYA